MIVIDSYVSMNVCALCVRSLLGLLFLFEWNLPNNSFLFYSTPFHGGASLCQIELYSPESTIFSLGRPQNLWLALKFEENSQFRGFLHQSASFFRKRTQKEIESSTLK